MRLTCTHKI